MKRSIWNSIRMKLAFYALTSAILTIISDFVVIWIIRVLRTAILNTSGGEPKTANILENQNHNWLHYGKPILSNNRLLDIAIVVAFSVIVFMIFYIVISHKMVDYFREIATGIKRIKNGDLETNISVQSDDEISDLAFSINEMRIELKNIIEQERRTEEAKNELITCVAHDLRTPLTSITGYLELMQNSEKLPPEVAERYMNIVYEKSIRLEKLINDLFDYTRYEKNKMVLHPVRLNMTQFVQQLVDEFYPSFQEKQLECICSITTDTIYYEGDGELLARAFGNLLSNAIKYGADGKQIRIEFHAIPSEDKLRIAITNYDNIIPPEDLSKIFNRFYRVDAARTGNNGGTGLGLAIAKNIIEMHEGRIRVTSDENGTVFEVTFDMEKGR